MLWLIVPAALAVILAALRSFKKRRARAEAGERGEAEVYQILENALPRRGVLFRNLYLPTVKGTTEIDLLLLTRKGIFVFEIKNYRGRIYGDERNGKWLKVQKGGRRQTFYNPVWQNEGHIRALLRLFPEINPRCVQSYIVFCGSSTLERIKIRSRGVRVLKQSELRRSLRWKLFWGFKKFSKPEIKALGEKLQEFEKAARQTKRKHRKQIERRRRDASA